MAQIDVRALAGRLLHQDRDKIDIMRIATPQQIITLIRMAQAVFASQPVLLELNPPVAVCGDIHGQFTDLLRIFKEMGYPPTTNYLFLGDYVDRGPLQLETIALLFCYKVAYPDNVFLLRGNHETAEVNNVYGFQEEISRRCPDNKRELGQIFNQAFAQMPLTALIGGRILTMHGGLSPHLRDKSQLRQLQRGWLDPKDDTLEIDLLWSDPLPGSQGWGPNTRGCSYVFGDDVVLAACARLDVDLIVRAHEVVMDGYELHKTRKLITLFSAPNYAHYPNAGAAMYVDRRLNCRFTQFRPERKNGQREE